MPLTAAEQRARRLAQQRRRVSSAQHAARRANSSVCPDDIDSDIDGADDSDSNGADDAFAAEASDGARSPAASSPGGSRPDSDNSNDGPSAALADSASHELSDGDAAACSAAYGAAVLRHCQRALQLLHDGGVRASAAAAAAPDARAGPFPLSDLILLARAAACSASSRMQRCRPTAAHCCQSAAIMLARRRASRGRHRGRLGWHS